jgi:transposase
MSKKNKKITIANPEALTRLRAIEFYQAGHSQRETAAKFNVHFTTIGEWVRMYAEGGAEALKVPLKPRPQHRLDPAELRALIGHVSEKYEPRIAALLDLAESKRLNETAAAHGITPQGLAKWRRDYLAGKWPGTVSV